MITISRNRVMNALLAIAAVAFAGVIAGCGGGGQDVSDSTRESPQAATASSSAISAPCLGCAFGPVTFVRHLKAPTVEKALVEGDPIADYVLNINDNASRGADASVTLDGVVLLAPLGAGEAGPRHVSVNVKLHAQSVLAVRLTGKPGSTLTIFIRGGAKIVGTEGGSVTSPGGAIHLDIPAGSLIAPTEIIIGPVAGPVPEGNLGAAFELGPSGLTFSTPATLTVKYDPAIVGPDWSEDILTLAVVSGSDWSDIQTKVNTVDKVLSAKLEHLSTYAFKEISGLCISSGNTAYDVSMAKLAQRVFGRSSPIYTGTGCVDEGYLQEDYSKYWPTLENHAGIDFLVPLGTKAYALLDGEVEDSRLNAATGSSTLVIKSTSGGTTYRILYLHCNSHIQFRNGVSLGSLDGTAKYIQKGDEVCQTGKVGALGYHLHLEVKTVTMDSINPLYAVSGGHCPGQFFTNHLGIYTAGCPLSYISKNTVDPTFLLNTDSLKFTQVDYPGATATLLWDINRSGVIVGAATLSGRQIGFKYSNGIFTPLPTRFGAAEFSAAGIDDSGVIVGHWYSNVALSDVSGFLFESSVYSLFNVPSPGSTFLRGISANGRYLAGMSGAGGWVFNRLTGVFFSTPFNTQVTNGVNNAGQVVGSAFPLAGITEGFILNVNSGARTKVSVPGFADNTVRPRAINDVGQVGGGIIGTGKVFFGTPGNFKIFDIPGATDAFIYGNNDAGQSVGWWIDAAGATHGFILSE